MLISIGIFIDQRKMSLHFFLYTLFVTHITVDCCSYLIVDNLFLLFCFYINSIHKEWLYNLFIQTITSKILYYIENYIFTKIVGK